MNRCLIVFDLDRKCLQDNYHNSSWQNAYEDIQKVLSKNGFKNIQGTVYLSDLGIRQAHGTVTLQEITIKFPWFEKCVSNIQFFDLADDFNAQFIVDQVAQARKAFEQRINKLRQQLLEAGLESTKIDEILGKEEFSLENSTQSDLISTK